MLNAGARRWFGSWYKQLIDQGIEGFWNDMNEPAIFYSEEGLAEAFCRMDELKEQKENPDLNAFWAMRRHHFNVQKQMAPPGLVIAGPDTAVAVHADVGRAGEEQQPLIRADFVKAFGGCAGHIVAFTPLMRNHAALGTREQECYQFEGLEDFRNILRLRYRLIPYLYSEYMKAALNSELLFTPLAFVWPQDTVARETEDQLLLGESLMLAPVYQQNTTGRHVYLPEDMLFILFTSSEKYTITPMSAGHHYISCGLSEVPVFLRPGHLLPLAPSCECTAQLEYSFFEVLGEAGKGLTYTMYADDGYTKHPERDGRWITITK